MDYRYEAPEEIRNYLNYMSTIRGRSERTCKEYYLDLRTFFRFLLKKRKMVPEETPWEEISIEQVDLPLIASVTLTDLYDFLAYAQKELPTYHKSPSTTYGNGSSARARKVAALRSFYRYLTEKVHKLDHNPVQNLESPKNKKSLPRHLSMEESVELLSHVESAYPERDYCIITLFLNCGLRVSELVGINLSDVRGDTLQVLGKGNKERVLFLNEACQQALQDWLTERNMLTLIDKEALFITHQNRRRISRAAVHKLVKKHLAASGLDSTQYSAHKLRHTAATLMLQNGVDVRTLQEVLGHDHLNTTQIYTHVDSDDLRTAARANPLGMVKKKKRGSEDET